MPRPSPCFLSNTPTRTIKAGGMTVWCSCVSENERETGGKERLMTPECCLIDTPSLANGSTSEDGGFDPLTRRWISHAQAHRSLSGPVIKAGNSESCVSDWGKHMKGRTNAAQRRIYVQRPQWIFVWYAMSLRQIYVQECMNVSHDSRLQFVTQSFPQFLSPCFI